MPLQGRKYKTKGRRKLAYRDSIRSRISGDLWITQLSMTITEFGAGNWFILPTRLLMNSKKSSPLKEPSTILQSSMPSIEIAGRTEYLVTRLASSRGCNIILPFSSGEELLSACAKTLKGVRFSPHVSSSIAGALVDANQLVSYVVFTHAKPKTCSIHFVSFSGMFSYLHRDSAAVCLL